MRSRMLLLLLLPLLMKPLLDDRPSASIVYSIGGLIYMSFMSVCLSVSFVYCRDSQNLNSTFICCGCVSEQVVQQIQVVYNKSTTSRSR